MSPTLNVGDFLLVVRWPRRWLRCGHVVIAQHGGRTMVKRVSDINVETGAFRVIGDHSVASRDSRQFGALPPAALIGRAVLQVSPRGLQRVRSEIPDDPIGRRASDRPSEC